MTEEQNGTGSYIPVTDVDQVFPVLTGDRSAVGGGSSGPPGDQGPLIAAALRDVLGWRPRAQDTKAFSAALTASFTLTEYEGHVDATYVARGFAVQADLGAVSGGQASLYSRAQVARTQLVGLLDGLVPLRPDADPEDCEAYRLLVRHAVSRVVDELGSPGGPRQAVVDSSFGILLGRSSDESDADDVVGQLGALRDRFGLLDANVNTVDEERVRTSFWTLVDIVVDLRRAWIRQQKTLAGGTGSGFLGTDYVLLSRLLAAAAEQVDEVESVLDSVLVAAAERQTVELAKGLSLDGLLRWTREFLVEDGPLYVRDSGRDGMRTAFAPTVQGLYKELLDTVMTPLGGLATTGTAQRWLPLECGRRFPTGMHSARVRVAFAGLCRLMDELFTKSALIGRYPGVVMIDVEVEEIAMVRDGSADEFLQLPPLAERDFYARITLRGANLRSHYVPALLKEDWEGQAKLPLNLPLQNSTTAGGDRISGIFLLTPGQLEEWNTPGDARQLTDTGSYLFPAQSVPVAVVDSETGEVIQSPAAVYWPWQTQEDVFTSVRTGGLPWHESVKAQPTIRPEVDGELLRRVLDRRNLP
jgi:hypothetical protein